MIVVSNASPLISLAKVGRLSLLTDLFHSVRITPEVYREVVTVGAGRIASTEIQNASWIRVESCSDAARLQHWRQEHGLGLGELATVLLAQEIKADLAIIDERAARQLATGLGLKVIGCVGIPEIAHRRGLAPNLRATYQQLVRVGTYIDRRILERGLVAFNLPPL